MRLRPLGILLLLVFAIQMPLLAQDNKDNINAIDTYFKQYVDDDRFTVVYISGKLFQMLGKLDKETLNVEGDEEAQALMDIAADMQGLRILTAEVGADALYNEAKQKIDTKIYQQLMTVRSRDGDNFELLIRENNEGKIQELLMLGGGDEFVLMSFIGNLDLDKISRLADEFEH
jgi:hypothetical protein